MFNARCIITLDLLVLVERMQYFFGVFQDLSLTLNRAYARIHPLWRVIVFRTLITYRDGDGPMVSHCPWAPISASGHLWNSRSSGKFYRVGVYINQPVSSFIHSSLFAQKLQYDTTKNNKNWAGWKGHLTAAGFMSQRPHPYSTRILGVFPLD